MFYYKSAKKRHVQMRYETKVESLEKVDDLFHLKTSKGDYESPVVIVATGGLSYPHTGSTGEGYVWAKSLGHKIIPD